MTMMMMMIMMTVK